MTELLEKVLEAALFKKKAVSVGMSRCAKKAVHEELPFLYGIRCSACG